MKTKIVNTYNGIALQYEETGEYLVVKKENYIALQDGIKEDSKELRVSDLLLSKVSELRRESIANKETLIRYFSKQAAGQNHPVTDDFVKIVTQLLFSKRIYCEVTNDGPVLHLEDYKLQLNGKGCLELIFDNDVQNPMQSMDVNIYKYLSSSSRPREVLFNVLVQMASKGAYALCKYLMLQSKIYEFADLLMKISAEAGENVVYKQKFEDNILNNKEVDQIDIKRTDNCITINNKGKIIKIDGGDAIALTIDGDIITISSKGMKDDISKSKSLEEALNKVKTRVAEVVLPCGDKAKDLYLAKIKPVAGDFAKAIVTPIFMVEEEKEIKQSVKNTGGNSNTQNTSNTGTNKNNKSFNKNANQKIKNSNKVDSDDNNQQNSKPSNTLNYILFAAMVGVIVLLFIIGGL